MSKKLGEYETSAEYKMKRFRATIKYMESIEKDKRDKLINKLSEEL